MTDASPTPTAPALDPLAQPLAGRADDALAIYLEAVCDLVAAPMRAAKRTFEQQIDESVALLDAGRETDGSRSALAHWQAVTAYRGSLRDALSTMLGALEQVAPASALAQARRALLNAWQNDAAFESEAVSRPTPDVLFDAQKADTLYVNVRKSMTRTGRKLRSSPPDQTIPLGALARYHTVVRMPTALLPTFRSAEQDVAHVAATVEALGTDAVYAALRAEQRCRRYAFFLTPDERRAAVLPSVEASGALPVPPPSIGQAVGSEVVPTGGS